MRRRVTLTLLQAAEGKKLELQRSYLIRTLAHLQEFDLDNCREYPGLEETLIKLREAQGGSLVPRRAQAVALHATAHLPFVHPIYHSLSTELIFEAAAEKEIQVAYALLRAGEYLNLATLAEGSDNVTAAVLAYAAATDFYRVGAFPVLGYYCLRQSHHLMGIAKLESAPFRPNALFSMLTPYELWDLVIRSGDESSQWVLVQHIGDYMSAVATTLLEDINLEHERAGEFLLDFMLLATQYAKGRMLSEQLVAIRNLQGSSSVHALVEPPEVPLRGLSPDWRIETDDETSDFKNLLLAASYSSREFLGSDDGGRE